MTRRLRNRATGTQFKDANGRLILSHRRRWTDGSVWWRARGSVEGLEEVVGDVPADGFSVELALDRGPAEVESHPDAGDRVLSRGLGEGIEVVDDGGVAFAAGGERCAALGDGEVISSDDLP